MIVKPKKAKKVTPSHCEIVVVLDRSGSMSDICRDMEGGFNTFIKEQKEVEGTCNVTLVQFDDNCGPQIETIYEAKPIAEVPNLVLIPRGSTPLLDAVGKTLANTQTRVTDKDAKVIFMIITDGQENASREWTREKIKNQIEDRTKDGWLFQFLGANVDSFSEASSLGISRLSTMDFKKSGAAVNSLYAASSKSVGTYRTSSLKGDELLRESAFTDEDRKNTMDGEI